MSRKKKLGISLADLSKLRPSATSIRFRSASICRDCSVNALIRR